MSLLSLLSANVYADAGFTDRNHLSSSTPDYLAEQPQAFLISALKIASSLLDHLSNLFL